MLNDYNSYFELIKQKPNQMGPNGGLNTSIYSQGQTNPALPTNDQQNEERQPPITSRRGKLLLGGQPTTDLRGSPNTPFSAKEEELFNWVSIVASNPHIKILSKDNLDTLLDYFESQRDVEWHCKRDSLLELKKLE